MLLPSQKTSTRTQFYVRTRSGAWVESNDYNTIEEARKDFAREWWRGRQPAIVQKTTTETVVEEGE